MLQGNHQLDSRRRLAAKLLVDYGADVLKIELNVEFGIAIRFRTNRPKERLGFELKHRPICCCPFSRAGIRGIS